MRDPSSPSPFQGEGRGEGPARSAAFARTHPLPNPPPKRGRGRILIIGSTGQLATALAAASGQVRLAGRPALDFDRPDTLTQTFAAASPTLVVNAAAWTAVDQAEAEPDAARRANVNGPARLAALCAAAGIPLIHVSTDYVFDGLKGSPYVETDPTSPTGVYGRTKLEGEHAALAANPRTIILRTSWVYSATGKNFVKTMLAAGQVRDTLRVVADQRGCPTAAADLAEAILAHRNPTGVRLGGPLRRRVPRRRRGGNHLARPGRRDLRGSGTARPQTSRRRTDRHGGLAHPRPPPAGQPPGLRQAGGRLRRALARVAPQPGPHGGRATYTNVGWVTLLQRNPPYTCAVTP